MVELRYLVKRNCKMFFQDKGMLFTSIITPLILLTLFATFLSNVYRESFTANLPEGFSVAESVIDGLVGGELVSSLLAVSCVTIAFCANMLMVQDKATGARRDLTVSPVKKSTLAISYYLATLLATLIIICLAAGACLLYLSDAWYLSTADVLYLLLDIFLLTMFGTVLSSIINMYLSSQGQITAVGTIISSGYGFICGAYMPISNFSPALRKALSFLPGTYGTSLVRNHAMNGVFAEMDRLGFPDQAVQAIRDSVDCNLYFFGERVAISTMYLVLAGSVALLLALYVLLNALRRGRR